MEKFNKTQKNNEKAITLIALVITIIVLLILAGISITMLTGNNSILQKATDAKMNTERKSVIELAQTDILGQIAENKGENISKEQLATILNKYFKTIDANTIPDIVSATKDLELTSIDNKYKIKLSEIYNGKFQTIPVKTSNFSIGDKTYDFVDGSTFEEWVNSEYNTDGYQIYAWNFPSGLHGGDILDRYGCFLENSAGKGIYRNDVINSTERYSLGTF